MSADNVIPLPKRPVDPKPRFVVWVAPPGVLLNPQCSDSVHHFTDIEKPCQCGQETWPE